MTLPNQPAAGLGAFPAVDLGLLHPHTAVTGADGSIPALTGLTQPAAENLLKSLYVKDNPSINNALTSIFPAPLRGGVSLALSIIEAITNAITGQHNIFLNVGHALGDLIGKIPLVSDMLNILRSLLPKVFLDAFSEFFDKLFSGNIGGALGVVVSFLGKAGSGVLHTLETLGQWIFGLFGVTGNGEASILSRLWDWVKHSLHLDRFGEIFGGIWHFITGALGMFFNLSGEGSLLSKIWHTVKSFLHLGGIGAVFSGVWHFVTGFIGMFVDFNGGGSLLSKIWKGIKNALHLGMVGEIFSGVGHFITGAVGMFINLNGAGSLWSKIVGWVKGIFKGFGFGGIIGDIINIIQTVVAFITNPGSLWAKIKNLFGGLFSIKTRLGDTSVGALVSDAFAIFSNPNGAEGSITQRIYKLLWPIINCFGFTGKIFTFLHNITTFFDDPTGNGSVLGKIVDAVKGLLGGSGVFSKIGDIVKDVLGVFSNPGGFSFGSLLQGVLKLLGLDKIAGLAGGLLGGNLGSALNFFGSPKSPSDLLQSGTPASMLLGKVTGWLGLGDTSQGTGGLAGMFTNVMGDFTKMIGSPAGLGTGLGNLTMGPMLPPVDLGRSFGTLAPFQFGAMPAGAVASTPTQASNLVNEGAFRDAATVVAGQGWSYDNTEGRTIPGALKVEADGAQNEMVANQIPVVAGQTFNLSAYVKWAGLSYTGSDPIAIGITGYDYQPLAKTYMELASVDVATLAAPAASGGWQQIAGTYTVPDTDTPDVIRFRLKIGGNLTAGSVWFDEVSAINTDLVQDTVVPGIGHILDNGVNGFENLFDSGWGHSDFFGAAQGQNFSTIGLATRVNYLEARLTAGVAATDDFERVNATDLGGNWVESYSGSGAGVWATPNGHDASWAPSGTGTREVLCRFAGTGATSNTDTQKISAVLGSKAETASSGSAYNDLFGRMSSDNLNYIRARFGADGTVKIHKCIAGVLTQIGSTATVTTPSSGASIALLCGTASGTRYFQAHINGQAVSFAGSTEVNDTTSNLGASYRGWGQGARAENKNYYTQCAPAALNSWAAIDN